MAIWGIITFLFLSPIFSQPEKYWELKQEELEKLIQTCDVVVLGTLAEKHIKVEEILQGLQQIPKKIILAEAVKYNGDADSNYIFFLKRENIGFSVLHSIKSDIFIMDRVRKEVIRNRIQSSNYVAIGIVLTLNEEQKDSKFEVSAECKLLEAYKGQLPEKFTITYTRIPNTQPPTLFLFENIAYVFFIKGNIAKGNLQLINSYDGALIHRTQIVKDLKATMVGPSNRLEDVAGKVVEGIQLIAQTEQTVAWRQPIMVNVVLQNVSTTDIEIYHNPEQIPYFILFHVFDESGKPITIEYPRKNNVPDVDKNHFLKLATSDYCLFQAFDLQQYCKLPPGKYVMYVEYDLPWKYAGKGVGKSAWSGKVISNRAELNIIN